MRTAFGMTRRVFLGSTAAAAGGLLRTNAAEGRAARRQASAPVVTRTDLIYGRVEGSALLANIAYPDGPGPRAAILSIHGGRWRAGNRTDASSIKVQQWAEFGFFAMSIDYRLVGGSPAPAPYLDLLCAIRWMHAHAENCVSTPIASISFNLPAATWCRSLPPLAKAATRGSADGRKRAPTFAP